MGAMEYHFKCAVERGRSSSGTILHDGFTAVTAYEKCFSTLRHDLLKICPMIKGNKRAKFIVIGKYQ
jgi:hypothetical protein